jgi:prophage tail gpP-like protein
VDNRSTVSLTLDGHKFTGWKSFSASFDMEQFVNQCRFDLFDKDGSLIHGMPSGSTGSPFETGLSCSVSVQNQAVFGDTDILNGFVVSDTDTEDGNSNQMSIVAADKTVDLLDCSAIHESQTWTNKAFSKIVRDLAQPFGITVVSTLLERDSQIKKFTVQSGESPFDAIERLCRHEAVLPLSSLDGKLVLGYAATSAERAVEALEVGVNVTSAQRSRDWTERFSDYTVIGQGAGSGKRWTKELLQAAATARDIGVSRHRPKLIVAENKLTQKLAIQRVKWEAQIRSGRSTEFRVTKRGWFQTIGGTPARLWETNQRVDFRWPSRGVDREFLITGVELSLGSGGEITTLTLKHPDVFNPQPGLQVDLTP